MIYATIGSVNHKVEFHPEAPKVPKDLKTRLLRPALSVPVYGTRKDEFLLTNDQ